MRNTILSLVSGFLVLSAAVPSAYADDPTSRYLSLAGLPSLLAPSSTGVSVQIEIRDQANGGALVYAEPHTVDTDSAANISNDTGFFDLLLGRPNGLDPANFPYGSSRYLDVTQGGSSVLFAAVPLYASPFALTTSGKVSGNLDLVNSTATAGIITKSGVRFLHNFGSENVFLGGDAGNLTTSGQRISVVGTFALSSNTTGLDGTALGHGALNHNTTGNGNVAVGSAALFSNDTGSDNVAVGYQALFSNRSRANTACGTQALRSNSTGVDNAAYGWFALPNNTTGNGNTAIGKNTLLSNTSGASNTAIGEGAMFTNATGSFNTVVGLNADVGSSNLQNATAIGNGAVVNASNKIRLGNSMVSVIEGQVAYTFSSDKTKKENFRPVDREAVLAKFRDLDVSSWNYIGQDAKQFRHYGPMAQDFFAAFGSDSIGKVGAPTTLNSGDVAGIQMIATQALEKRTAHQKKEIEVLRGENRELKARLEALERRLGSAR